jgi:hypothetical protein
MEGGGKIRNMNKLKNWDYKDFLGLVEYLQNNWVWPSMVKFHWGKEKLHKSPVLYLELHTGGHSHNEEIITDLLENKMICMMWYQKWERGGHYYFEINPYNVGYKKVSEVAKETGCSRQNIHKQPEKYQWITAGQKIKLVRVEK